MLTKLIKANFRKDLSQMISFLLIVILSSTMLGCGLTLLVGYSSDYKKKLDDNNAADVRIHLSGPAEYRQNDLGELERYLASDPDIESYEIVSGLLTNASLEQDDEYSKDLSDSESVTAMITPLDEDRDIERLNFTMKSDEELEDPLYISDYVYRQKYNGRFDIGDEIALVVGGHTFVFHLAGIYESIMFEECFYVTESQYSDIADLADPGHPAFDDFIAVKIADGVDDDRVSDRISDEFQRRDLDCRISQYTRSMMVEADLIMVNIVSAILCAFSLLVTLVVLIIVFFRISNSIEQNIVNIGALKAMGCTGRQIRSSHILEFIITSVAGTLIGIFAVYLLLPSLADLVGSMTMMTWEAHMIPGIAILLPLFFALLTGVMATLSTSRISDLDPVIALRFGLQNHSFKKNHLPLATTGGPLVGLLALKSSLQSKKQNIMTFIIMAAVGIVMAFAVFFGYNICYKPVNLYRMLQPMPYDMSMSIDDPEAYYDLVDIEHVRNCGWRAIVEMTVAGQTADVTVVEDLNSVDNINFTEGRAPLYPDEIIMSATAARQTGVMVGDIVKVSYKGTEKEMIVSGLAQGTDNLGKFALMNDDAARSLGYTAKTRTVTLCFDEPTVAVSRQVLDEVESIYGDKLRAYVNIIELLPEEPIIVGSTAICILIVIVTVLVILLSMSLLIKTVIIRKQQEFGIKKALGFTSEQLRRELTISMLPCVIAGNSVGSLIGTVKANDFLTALLSSLGMARSNLPVYALMGIVSVLLTTLASVVIVWILSSKIKKISAYALIKE